MGLLQKPTNPGLDAAACIVESCSKYEHGLFTSNAGKLSPSYDAQCLCASSRSPSSQNRRAIPISQKHLVP